MDQPEESPQRRNQGDAELAATIDAAVKAAQAFVFEWDIGMDRVIRRGGGPLPPTPPDGEPVERFLSFVHPEDLPRMRQIIDRAVAAPGEAYQTNYRVLGRDGAVHWLNEAGKAEAGPDGLPRRMLGVTRDVTELFTAQRRLQESEQKLRLSIQELEQLYARAPLGLAMLDEELRFVRVNDALAQMNGLGAAEHIGRHLWDVVPDLRVSAEPGMRQVLERGAVVRDVEVTGTTAADPGTRHEWREQFYPLRDHAGAVTGVGVVCEDVTERRRLERELRGRESHLRAVLDQLFAFAGTLTPQGIIVQANRAALAAFGIDCDDLAGKALVDLPWIAHDPDTQAHLRDSIERAAAGENVRYDLSLGTGDGNLTTIDFQLAPLRDDTGAVTHLIASGVPIGDRLAVEAKLRALNQQLEQRVADEVQRQKVAQAALFQAQKLEALGQLTAGIAHDFNNLVAAMAGGFGLILKWSTNERITQVARQGALAAQRGAELVKHLLAFSRNQVLSPRVLDLGELIAEAKPLLRQSAGSKVRLVIDCPADCPRVRVDPAKLESALINLAVNARDAMPQGGTLSIGVETQTTPDPRLPGGAIAIVVRDTGAGMPPDVLARAGEPFFTTKGVGKGTGLGLAMVHGFAEQSGGLLTITSEPDAGTTVRLVLPVAEQREEPCRKDRPLADEPPGEGAEILLVDDDDLVRGITAQLLDDLGYRVTEADSGKSAMRLVKRGRQFDLLLCDVVMPEEDGPGFVARLQSAGQALPVVFMTGHADRSRLAGATVIDKPFTQDALHRAVSAALRDSKPSRPAQLPLFAPGPQAVGRNGAS